MEELELFCSCPLCGAGAAVVSQQGVWRADGHRETVSQGFVHRQSFPQLWSLLCGPAGHDQNQGGMTPINTQRKRQKYKQAKETKTVAFSVLHGGKSLF